MIIVVDAEARFVVDCTRVGDGTSAVGDCTRVGDGTSAVGDCAIVGDGTSAVGAVIGDGASICDCQSHARINC